MLQKLRRTRSPRTRSPESKDATQQKLSRSPARMDVAARMCGSAIEIKRLLKWFSWRRYLAARVNNTVYRERNTAASCRTRGRDGAAAFARVHISMDGTSWDVLAVRGQSRAASATCRQSTAMVETFAVTAALTLGAQSMPKRPVIRAVGDSEPQAKADQACSSRRQFTIMQLHRRTSLASEVELEAASAHCHCQFSGSFKLNDRGVHS